MFNATQHELQSMTLKRYDHGDFHVASVNWIHVITITIREATCAGWKELCKGSAASLRFSLGDCRPKGSHATFVVDYKE
jgi:hypothetical protein